MMSYVIKNKKKSAAQPVEFACLLLFICSMPFYLLGTLGGFSIPKIISIGVGLVLLLVCFNKRLTICKSMIWWMLYTFYLLVSCIWSGSFALSFSYAQGMLFILAICFLLSITEALSDEQKELVKTIEICLTLAVIALVLFSSDFTKYNQRVQVTILGKESLDPNEMCTYFLLGIAFSMERLFQKNRWYKKLIYIAVPVLSLFSALLLGSRGGLIACFSVVLLMFFYQFRHSWKSVVALLVLAAIVCVVFAEIIMPTLPANLLNRFTSDGLEKSLRFTIWSDYYESFADNIGRMLFGWGARGSYGISYTNVLHNMIFQTLIDCGLVGFVFYAGMLLSLFRDSRRAGYAVSFAFIGCQVALLSLSTYANMKMVWTIYILCIILGKNRKSDAEDNGVILGKAYNGQI